MTAGRTNHTMFSAADPKFVSQTAERDCRDCHHCACDPDGLFCGHQTSMRQGAPWGWGIAKARTDGFPCGPDALLFEKAPENLMKARGRA